jgi:hypothetical protein
MFCVLSQIGFVIVDVAAGSLGIPSLAYLIIALGVAQLVYQIATIMKLAKALGFSPILYAILMFIPCVSLLALLSVSGTATKRLQKAGIKVGLLGADPNSI